jgi:hypothetical protein
MAYEIEQETVVLFCEDLWGTVLELLSDFEHLDHGFSLHGRVFVVLRV